MSAATTSPPPTALPVNRDGIAAAIADIPQWVAWRWEWRADHDGEAGKWTKPPLSPVTGRYASSTDATTWAPFEAALAFAHRQGIPGVGFVVTRHDPYVGIDLDTCRNPETGEIAPWASAIIARFDSYTEITPSETGVRILIRAAGGLLPDGSKGRRKGAIEIYGTDRYFTVTGHRLGERRTIEERSAELVALYDEVFGPPPAPSSHPSPNGSVSLSDDDVLALARNADNGAKFLRLWAGDTREHGGDDSAADLALLGVLSFYSQDPGQLDRLFRRSGLNREKWNRDDYRRRTIAKALDRSEVYAPRDRDPEPGHNGARADTDRPTGPTAPWPALDPAALHGLAGAIVNAISPHTESDAAAILLSFLAMFGNAVGRSPHARVGATRHHANEFVVLVGDTARARKGTAYHEVRRLFERADAAWVSRVMGGLSSGEGLIHAVRDASYKTDRRGNEVLEDPGVGDKRLLAAESEFASVLRVASRDGNTLSEILRRGWDGDDLRTLTRNSPLCATRPHVSLLGHITRAELLRELTETSQANGWANRHLFACVRRSKLLPHGGALSEDEVTDLEKRLKAVLQTARTRGELRRDEAANRVWEAVYPHLTADRLGMFGSITARAEAHVLRLSLIYALVDGATAIARPHLEAALAVWQYGEHSARFIFGDATGDPVADAILTALRANGRMTQTQISELFARNHKAGRLQAALASLLSAHKVRSRQGESENGRPPTYWEAV